MSRQTYLVQDILSLSQDHLLRIPKRGWSTLESTPNCVHSPLLSPYGSMDSLIEKEEYGDG